ncbi:MAG TPA: hypothetical protein VFZ17_02420 [Acidimicrobiia bacterium]|nr:hypothetical protein [Acidimicrobiia bacterium]
MELTEKLTGSVVVPHPSGAEKPISDARFVPLATLADSVQHGSALSTPWSAVHARQVAAPVVVIGTAVVHEPPAVIWNQYDVEPGSPQLCAVPAAAGLAIEPMIAGAVHAAAPAIPALRMSSRRDMPVEELPLLRAICPLLLGRGLPSAAICLQVRRGHPRGAGGTTDESRCPVALPYATQRSKNRGVRVHAE